jgi:hypothetical protein
MMTSRFAAFGISRDAVALAVFSGQELECWKVRSLPTDGQKASNSAGAFARWVVETMRPGAAGVECGPTTARRDALRDQLHSVLKEYGIPILAAGPEELFAAFRNPPLRKRGDLRRIVLTIFPQIQGQQVDLPLLDAAALGLLLQTRRLLAIN